RRLLLRAGDVAVLLAQGDDGRDAQRFQILELRVRRLAAAIQPLVHLGEAHRALLAAQLVETHLTLLIGDGDARARIAEPRRAGHVLGRARGQRRGTPDHERGGMGSHVGSPSLHYKMRPAWQWSKRAMMYYTVPEMGHHPELEAAVFVKAVDAGSMRAAALALGVPKSTVARRIAGLEDRLGVRLLERTTRQLRVTDAGKRYHDEARVALAALERAERAATELQSAPRGVLRVTLPVNLGLLFVPELLAEFSRQYPELRVIVDVSDRVVDLIREGFDVALRAGPARLRDSSMVVHRISESAIRLFASPEYLRRRGAPKRPEELADHDCLLFGTGERETWALTEKHRRRSISVRGRVAMNS